jgi:DnaJ like chaperone protein
VNDTNRIYLFVPETETENAGEKRTAQSRASSLPEEVKKALFFFGLNENATFEEVKSAYRKCMAEYHPDKVSHLGEEFQKIAEEKTKAYNMAFDVVKKYFKRNT